MGLRISSLIFALMMGGFSHGTSATGTDQQRNNAKNQARQQILSEIPRRDRQRAEASSLAQIVESMNGPQRASAASKIQNLIPRYRNNPAALGELGTALATLGQEQEAAGLATQLQNDHPSSPAGFLLEAQVSAKDNPAQARMMAKEAISRAQRIGDFATVGLAKSIYRLSRPDSTVQAGDIATGSGSTVIKEWATPRTARDVNINLGERQAIAAAAQFISRTKTGGNNVYAVLPQVSFRQPEAGTDNGFLSENVYLETLPNGEKVLVVVMSKDTLEADIRSLGPKLSGLLGRAQYVEANNGEVSALSAKTVELFHTAWTHGELLMQSAGAAIRSTVGKLGDYVSTVWSAWTGNLNDTPREDLNQQALKNINNSSLNQRADSFGRLKTMAFGAGIAARDAHLGNRLASRDEETKRNLQAQDRLFQSEWQASGR